MRRASARAPGHVTVFFSIHDGHEDPLRRGSRGAGFCTALGATATVFLSDRDAITIDGRRTDMGVVRRAVDIVRGEGEDRPVAVVLHAELPLGQGFGMSGALALAAALAASEVLDSDADPVAAAHVAEVLEGTGLGDVAAQAVGGFEMRVVEGGPPHGWVVPLDIRADIVSLVVLGPPLRTPDALSDGRLRTAISHEGERALARLAASPSLDDFCRLGREFALRTGLMTPAIESFVIGCGADRAGMCMLGHSAFAFAPVEGTIQTGIGGAAGIVDT